ncbi:MAG: hypothetical protein HYU51_15955 [Candidatus Rokubacteria bacterium]|nr:hypothetical protein [Candidatus Rokubacteria bacterium]
METPKAWYWWVLCARGCSDRRISENYEGDPKWFEETCATPGCNGTMTVLDVPPTVDPPGENEPDR